MLYRFTCRFNDTFALVVFFSYLLLFLVTFLMVFLHPFVGLVLFMLGILALVVVWFVILGGRGFERALARSGLRDGSCPDCGAGLAVVPGPGDPAMVTACTACTLRYEDDGRRVSDWEDAEDDSEDSEESGLDADLGTHEGAPTTDGTRPDPETL